MSKTIDDLGGYGMSSDQIKMYSTLNNQKSYQDYVNQQKQNYKSMASNPFMWLATGIKGEGWNENDYLKNRGIDDNTAKLGETGQLSSSDVDELRSYGRNYDRKLGSDLEAGKNLFGGIPLVGEILNPWGQLASAGKDIAESGTSKWENGKRDWVSDLGALGEVAFDVAGMGALGNAAKGGTKLMSNVGKTALRTGALGAGENAFSTLREEGKDANLGDVMLGGAIGGAFGGGLGAISQFGGNAANIAKQVRSPQMQALNGYYQQALAGRAQPLNPARMLGDGVGGASVGTAGNYLDWVPKQAKAAMERSGTPLAKTGLGRVAQGIADSRAIYGSPLSSIANSKLGQTTKNILKTPYGKIGAGVGGGLLVANLLRGNGQPAQEMSDAELEQLMNYYNGGY
jgi:hypothetical protein